MIEGSREEGEDPEVPRFTKIFKWSLLIALSKYL